MTEELLTESPMTEDLLTRIKRETNERLEELRGAVEERDRLQADLRALEVEPEMLRGDLGIEDRDLGVGEADPGMEVGAPERSPETSRSPVRRQLPRTRMVSPKVARLMRSPRRLPLERPEALVRRKSTHVDSFPGEDHIAGSGSGSEEAVDEIDLPVVLYEHSIQLG